MLSDKILEALIVLTMELAEFCVGILDTCVEDEGLSEQAQANLMDNKNLIRKKQQAVADLMKLMYPSGVRQDESGKPSAN